MNYTKIQKLISFIVLFSFFFTSVFSFPNLRIFSKASASSGDFYNLVSLLVNEDIYSWIESNLKRYAKDIQNNLENTRVVILPVPKDSSAFNIASLNEWLFFDWYKSLDKSVDFNSKLIWTILVWDITLPIINNLSDSSISIAPYVDFEDKAFIFNHTTWKYEKNRNSKDKFKPEIWHWIINPHTLVKEDDIKKINDFLDKNHDFYVWKGLFKKSDKVLNWNKSESIDDNYKPFVFYYDQFREQKAIHYPAYKWYEAYLNNKEDLNYNRYSKELANKIQNEVLEAQNEEFDKLLSKINNDKISKLFKNSTWIDTSSTSTISTRYITEKIVKRFIEIFNKGTLSDFRTDVHNAWRYNEKNTIVNADLIPYLISVLDEVSDKVILDVDRQVSNKIDDFVINWLSRKIAIPVKIISKAKKEHTWTGYHYSWDCKQVYTNFLYWKKINDIKSAKDCSIYRWSTYNSWILVRASRGLNLNNATDDINKLKNTNTQCLSVISDWNWWKIINPLNFKWYWWWNTPLNLDKNSMKTGIFKLWITNSKQAIEPLFDINWSKKDENWTEYSPLDCFNNNLLLDEKREWMLDPLYIWDGSSYVCYNSYKLWNPNIWTITHTNWSCKHDNTIWKYDFPYRFEDYYKKYPHIDKEDGDFLTIHNVIFKKIPSYIIHKSPTSKELYSEIKNTVTPDLPIDKVRYIDFISARWNYKKIEYPEFFKFINSDSNNVNLLNIWKKFDYILKTKSNEINNIIKSESPNSLTWYDKNLYKILYWNKNYPSKIDLNSFINNQPDKEITIWGVKKKVNYKDLVVFSTYWNNLKTVSAKYKFIIDNYLSDQSLNKNYKFLLSKNKPEYEISYIWASGDAKNMYIKINPEEKKAISPYSNIINLNWILSSNIYWISLLPTTNQIITPWSNFWWSNDWMFKCAPPEWVNLWEWIPAVFCRIKNMLPPKIWISDWDCWESIFGVDNEKIYWKEWNISSERQWYLDDIEKTKNSECYWDFNWNWLNDCLEKRLEWSKLDFYSDSQRYYYNSNWSLIVIVKDKDNNRVYIDNNTTVNFFVDKIVDKENNKVVFDSSKQDYSREKYKNYINFSEFWIKTQAWKAKYTFTSSNKNVDVYLKAVLSLKYNKTQKTEILLKSDIIKIEIRWDRMFLSWANKVDNELNLWWNYAVANDKTNIYLLNKNNTSFDKYNSSIKNWDLILWLTNVNKSWENINFNFPLNLKILDQKSNVVYETILNNLNWLKPLLSLKKSGKYNIIIKDSKGFSTKKSFDVVAWKPVKVNLQLWSSVLENNWAVSTNFVVIYDKYNNPVTWEPFDIEISVSWDSIVFNNNNEKNIKLSTIQWFRAFRLKTGTNTWISKIKTKIFYAWEEILSTNQDLSVVSNVSTKLFTNDKVEVWNKKVTLNLSILDKNSNILSNLNSRVYLHVDKKYWKTIKPYFEVKNWKAKIEFITSKLAWKDIDFKFQIEWFKTIFSNKLSILPLKPLKVDLLPTKTKLEASPDSYTILNVELKDVYWNVVFTDNSTKLDLEILDDYKDIISSNLTTKTVKNWRNSFRIYATNIPWKAYVKVSTSPSLSSNTFEIKWQAPFLKEKVNNIAWIRKDWVLTNLWKKFFYEIDNTHYRFIQSTKVRLINSKAYKDLNAVTKVKLQKLFDSTNTYKINWVWENAISLETFYFWKASKINGNRYNSLYSVLLWADYANVTKKDYLASWILFDKNNRGLVVTSLLASPYEFKDILNLNSNWNIKKIVRKWDLSQNIKFNLTAWNKYPYIELYNANLATDIWKIYFRFWNDNSLKVCENAKCDLNKEKTSILWINTLQNYKYKVNGNSLILFDEYNNSIFTINNNWKIILNSNVSFSLSDTNSNYLYFDVKLNWRRIAWLWFNFVNWKIKVSKDKLVTNWLLQTSSNSIIVNLNSDIYWVREVYNTDNFRNIAIYYKDPFKKENSLNSFARWNFNNFDNFINKQWIWWKGWNKTLLEFAAWKTVGEAVKDFQSLLTVNLWDPVVSLKKKKIKKVYWEWYKKFDRTIGRKLNKFEIEWFKVFDYNNDNKDDLLFIKSDKYFSLLENQDISEDFINLKNLVRVEDLGDKKLVQTWDFTWDGYDDIFFVDNKWNPNILNNNLKDFVRFDLTQKFNLNAKITISKAFDMDHDWIDDIVTLDDNWTINIFYWNNNHTNPEFTKNTIYSWYWIKLSKNPRNDYGLVYFDKVPQLSVWNSNKDVIKSAEEFNKELTKAFENWNYNVNTKELYEKNSSWINEWLLNSLIYVQVPYWNINDSVLDNAVDVNEDTDNQLGWSLDNSQNELTDFISDYWDYVWDIKTNKTKQTTFIRSQYSEALWIKVEKVFKDRNWWNLKSWDIVNVTVKLINTTSHNINNLVYIEDFPNTFNYVKDSFKNSQNIKFKQASWVWKFLLEWITIAPWKEFTFSYNLKTKKFKFWYIDVWLFEKWELWDDLFWDIIFRKSKENCSQTVDIFRSIEKRKYEKWIKQPTCNDAKLTLPDKLNHADNDWNWIPDYLDEVINNKNKSKNFSQNYLNDLYKDSDWDWKPDDEDLNPNFWEDDDLMSGLDKLNDKVDKISAWIDKIVKGLWCGFGWGSCLALPMNWAPLAPWNDPTLYGTPVWDWLKVWEWLPLFSSLTWLQTSCWDSPCCLPTVWPTSSLAYVPGPYCWGSSAWWWLWTWSPTNTFRMFYTPTLTWWQWVAMCFWGPAIAAWNSIPMWVNPIIPGWNCIVAAAPIWTCNNDDENLWDPTSMWIVTNFDEWFSWWNWFGIISWNCSSWSSKNHKLLPETNKIDLGLVSNYLKYQRTWVISKNLINWFSNNFRNWNISSLNDNPLLSMDWWNDWLWNVDLSLDISSFASWDFKDVIQVKNTRISAFPDFLMDWVTRQIEEIVTKLTDFPTLFIILPDFSWIIDKSWWDYISQWVKKAYEKWKKQDERLDKQINEKISVLESRKSWLNCNWWDKIYCKSIDNQLSKLDSYKYLPWWKQYSWISEAYEFLSSVPIVSIQPETVNVNIPWIDRYTIDKTIKSWKTTLTQWKKEANRFKNEISLGKACSWEWDELKNCQKNNSINSKVSSDLSKRINSLEQNIAILEEWKKMPEKLYSLINKKDEWLDQILCNIESISNLMNGWIWKNWVRFKAWVETYILVKAILKSWQLLANLFIDFDAECHECKNERNDLLYFELKLVSFIIPKIPVIQFPKWPDLMLDLHNIRLAITINIPDFKLNKRPIVLPILPNLVLPSVPNVDINFPAIPLLPKFEIPELPDIPTLPKVELPDLPPPPKLPKLFSSIEGVLNILKLVAKALCILKKSPLVPEWRAWDQIAYLTERTWYLNTDFLDISLPQFSYPFVDAIKVTTWVNYEQDVDFLTEMARNIVEPINSFTSNIVNLFQFKPDAFDFSELTPSDIEINVWDDKVWFKDKSLLNLAYVISLSIWKFVNILNTQKSETLSNSDFIYLVNRSLSKKKFVSDSKYEELRKTWLNLEKLKLTKQDDIIKDALDNNREKFEVVKSIIKTEKLKNKVLKDEIKLIWAKKFKKVSDNTKNDFVIYNRQLEKYNKRVLQKANNLVKSGNKQKEELKSMWNNLLTRVKTGLNWFNKDYLAVNTVSDGTSTNNTSWMNSCQLANSKKIRYKYKWIYVVEDWNSYKLFDYIDNLSWKEEVVWIDYDNDSDKDLLYLVDNELYVKENLSIDDHKNYVSLNPLEVDVKDNKFLNWNLFIEAVNWFEETAVSNKRINFKFLWSNNENINNYRIEFYNRIDKFLRQWDVNYIPYNLPKTVIDSFSDVNNLWLIENKDSYKIYKNISYFNYIWTLPWVTLVTHKFNNISDSLRNWNLASITANKKLYSTNSNLTIYYIENDEKKEVNLDKYSNITFNNSVKIYKISWWDLFVDSWSKQIIKWQDILKYLHMPISFDTEIRVDDNRALTSASHIDIKYYDGSELWLDLRKLNSYKIYDLWFRSESYLVSISKENDYYYSKIYAFSDWVIWTKSNQVLLSPQLAADTTAPDLNFNSIIRIPVYQTKIIDFSDYIYDNSWIDNITEVKIEKLNPPNYSILRSPWKIKIKFGKFNNLFRTTIVISLKDKNWNIFKKDIAFEVYSPTPSIKKYDNWIINWVIDEDLKEEPINIYRVRWGIITKLETKDNKTKVYTYDYWEYDFDVKTDTNLFSQKLYLKDDLSKLLDINWATWKITLKKLWYSFSVENNSVYPSIYVLDKNTKIYRETIRLDGKSKINIVSDFSKIWNDKGLYLKLSSDKYWYYINPDNVSYNPWVLWIYRKSDINKTPLFNIFKDWRITTINNNYKLEYSSYGDYVVYKLIDKHFNRVVWELLLKINNNFIIK